MKRIAIVPGILLAAGLVSLSAADVPTYVGAGKCRDCHRAEKLGKQHPIWEASRHAQAFNDLKSETATNAAGESIPAQQAPACLKCHAPQFDKSPEVAVEGVTCETCHGPGSQYKKLSVMMDREAGVKNGLAFFAAQDAVQALCMTCHADAHGITFDFPKAWDAIKHYRPGK